MPRILPSSAHRARMANVRHALRLLDVVGGGPGSDVEDHALAGAWRDVIRSTGGGVATSLIRGEYGLETHTEANHALVETIRRELADVAGMILA